MKMNDPDMHIEAPSSPVFSSQRITHGRKSRRKSDVTVDGPSKPKSNSKSPRRPPLSPVFGSQRKLFGRRGRSHGAASTPCRKRKRHLDLNTDEDSSLFSPIEIVKESNKPESPSTAFLRGDDSFAESLDFEEVDSLCSNNNLVTDAKENNMSIPLNKNPICSSPYHLRKTPKRSLHKKQSQIRQNYKHEESDIEKDQYKPRKLHQASIPLTIVPESSSEGSVTSRSSNQEPPSAKTSMHVADGRVSPDIFGDADELDYMQGVTDSQMSSITDSQVFALEGDITDFKKPPERGQNKEEESQNSSAEIKSPDSINKSQDSFGESVSQTSFLSTQGSQPLLNRVQNKLSTITPSQHAKVGVKSDSERRAEFIAAAVEAAEVALGNDQFDLGPFFGLPSKVLDLYKEHRGITSLYDWQDECIRIGSSGTNLLFSLPTSGGKTLVAEVLMLRELLLKKRNCLLILPYVSLVQEKVRGLSLFGIELEFLVEEYAGSRGSLPPKAKRKKSVLYIATIEKASGLVNCLLESGRMGEVGLVVVDEVHMLAESGGRGALLEATITKLIYATPHLQLVAMSATVGNLQELAAFLRAQLYTGDFRPVELKEYVKIENKIWEINTAARTEEDLVTNQKMCWFPYTPEQKRVDVDQVGGLVAEVVPTHSCLVFCPTKRNCETLATLVTRILPKELTKLHVERKKALYRALMEEGAGTVCPVLRKTIPYGVAYHHSGLTDGERRLVEEGYLAGTLCCLTCTSTLAAGVNLPARRVIIRAPYIGAEFLSRAKYKQIVGRAGRAGMDSSGESILMLNPKDMKQAGELLTSPVEVSISTLAERECSGLVNLVFSSVGLGVAATPQQLKALARCSLLALQAQRLKVDVDAKVDEILETLRISGLVRLKAENGSQTCSHPNSVHPLDGNSCKSSKMSPGPSGSGPSCPDTADTTQPLQPLTPNCSLVVSRLGKATVKGNVDLKLSAQLYRDLIVARENLAVNSHLHLLYLVTPYDATNNIKVIPDVFFKAYNKLDVEELKVAKLLGITEAIAIRIRMGQVVKKLNESVLQRFYVALMLFQMWAGAGVWEASEMFNIHRGATQQLLASAAAFSSCVHHFCLELEELWAFGDLLGNFTRQLSGCCSAELLPLLDLPSVKNGRARLLYNAGYHTLKDIANAEAKNLTASIPHLPYRTACQIVSSAKMLLLEQADALQGEAEEVLSGLMQPMVIHAPLAVNQNTK